MKPFLATCLIWYDEPPRQLFDAVYSLGAISDAIVASDGAFELFPDGKPYSNFDQSEAICEAAEAAGMQCLLFRPDRLWRGECEKRQHVLDLACSLKPEWVMPFYAGDNKVVKGDRETLREQLDGNWAGEIKMHVLEGEHEPTNSNYEKAGETHKEPYIFRNVPHMEIGKRHWHLMGEVKQRRHSFSGNTGDPQVPLVPIDVTIEHANTQRSKERHEAKWAFYNARDAEIAQLGYER